MKPIRVGTRGSKLALAQTGFVVRDLQSMHSGLAVEVVTIKTTGDIRADVPFADVGSKGMFVREIEEALLEGAIDFAVHSLKDMPAEITEGLSLAATPARADPRDALVASSTLKELPEGARVGTSSVRRKAQVWAVRPDLMVEELRGNLDTRLKKLDEGNYDAIILACAGLDRLSLGVRIRERLPLEDFVPAPGQGALALQIRSGNTAMKDLLDPLNDSQSADAVSAERSFQSTLQAGCTFPIGAHAMIDGDDIRFLAMLASLNASDSVRIELRGTRRSAEELGRNAALELLKSGWNPMMRESD